MILSISKSNRKNIKKSKKIYNDKRISFAIVLQFCMLITNYTFKQVFKITSPGVRAMISGIFMVLVGIYFISIIKVVFDRVGKIFISSYLISFIIILLNMLFFPSNLQYLLEISFYLLLICMPIFIYYTAIYDKSILLEMLIKSSYYQMMLGIVFFIATDFSVIRYDMVFSYLILVPVETLLYKIYRDFSIVDVLLVFVGIMMIIIMGSRGPLLSLILFWFFLAIKYIHNSKNIVKYFITTCLFIAVIIIISLNFDIMIVKLNLILENMGFRSRTLRIFLSNSVDFSSGRINIYSFIVECIKERPLLGYGLAGDRVLLGGTYPHNFFLEVLVQFGVIIGGLIIILFIYFYINGIFNNKDEVETDLALLFFGIGFVQLLVSGSYLTSGNFWLFMSICINSTNTIKHKFYNDSEVNK
ncbi:O-antigen ligase family protein [Anaerosalibacter bizertensis]|uniref:O-antigen ligase family protein n=1 Tax=Anaerosalibacter bizertensis TaxID=932217 RepID=A0A844FJM2_9FIRM|nr:O-antigen ligase family protein [Anaerosalibacter bizertensis]MSS44169.1 O-antigen ligase family protein [Anaerosalibacter bizertensis]